MIMDYISNLYRRRCRPFKDSNLERTIVWRWALPGAKLFPDWHRFASGDWCNRCQYWPGVGEVGFRGEPIPERRHWRADTDRPRLPGQGFLGELEWFQEGAPVGVLALPPLPNVECPHFPEDAGVVIGGTAHTIRPAPSTGGVQVDGAALWFRGGAVLLGGVARFTLALRYQGHGGLVLGGQARWSLYFPPPLSSTCGVLMDGCARFWTSTTRLTGGGVVLDGLTPWSRTGRWTALGAVRLDGGARLKPPFRMAGRGGIRADGTATAKYRKGQKATGGVRCDGSAKVPPIRRGRGTGGVLCDGTAAYTFKKRPTPQTARGGVLANGTASATFTAGNAVPPCDHWPYSAVYARFTAPGCACINGKTIVLLSQAQFQVGVPWAGSGQDPCTDAAMAYGVTCVTVNGSSQFTWLFSIGTPGVPMQVVTSAPMHLRATYPQPGCPGATATVDVMPF